MITALDLCQFGRLAEATYAVLNERDEALAGTELGLLLKQNGSGPGGKPWPAPPADDFVKNWRVVSHRPNTASGFSATLYERIGAGAPTGEFALATRGTEPTADIYLTDLQADIGDIVANGLAWEQIIDLYNYWQEISTPEGVPLSLAKAEPLDYTDARRRQLENGESGIILEPGGLEAWKISVVSGGDENKGLGRVPPGCQSASPATVWADTLR